MKKFVSLHTQHIMMYIPLVNSLILFVWLFNYHNLQKDYKIFGKSLIIMFCIGVPMAILQIILSKAFVNFPVVVSILNIIAIYLIPFALGFAMIKYQEKIFKL